MIIDEKDLLHYGILRKSGRYPWGSGDNVSQRSKTFLDMIEDLKRRLGFTDSEVAEAVGLKSSTELRQVRAIAKNELKKAQIIQAQRLQDAGNSNVAIGREMGIPESTVRTLLKDQAKAKEDVLATTSNMLQSEVDAKRFLDVGTGTENYLGISKERKDTAIAMLVDQGYKVYYVKVPQIGAPGNETTVKVLCPPDTTYSELYKNRGDIKTLQNFSDDGGRSYFGLVDPIAVSPSRIAVRYGPDGGNATDGVIYVRPGKSDLDLGGSRYAQVRVKVGNDHYMKGMAMYKDDLPEGVDLMFNTNKSDTGNKLDAFKPIKDDPDNPFGSYIRRQITSKREDGTEYATSAMNLVNEEGSWDRWSRSLASQVLSKQSPELAKSQLNMTSERRQQEYDDILALTNPTVRKKMLEDFADATDAASVHLKAASLDRQRWQVILPVETMSDREIYAPNFRDGEVVALIRYPHGGTFEIPELTVNNRHSDAVKALGQAKDAVGVNVATAQHLSGADFDGDTVLVIPNNSRQIRTSPALQKLKGFDPVTSYPAYEGMPRLSEKRKQAEMGDISNLITDMTIKNASHAEIAAAVRHSMVVIDAEKHNLNYRQSAIDNGIPALKEKYQGAKRAGAATLISKAKSPVRVNERKARLASEGGPVDPRTGRKVFTETGRTYVNAKGETVPSKSKVKALALVEDAAELSSGTPMERIYVDHSNKLKGLANEARLAALNTPRAEYNPAAARTYHEEVASLSAKLDVAISNRPLERNAQVVANAISKQRRDANPNMDPATRKKIEFQALEEARRRTGADRSRIVITNAEWDAIQAGAISDSKLSSILEKADMDVVRELATPRDHVLMTPVKQQRAQAMVASGFTASEIADALGVSVSTLNRSMSGEQ